MSRSKELNKTPPTEVVKSVQLDLFSDFITNDKETVSNTVEIWESIPKYFFTPHQVEKLRTKDGLAKPYKWNYTFNRISCAVEIQPALIKQENGEYKAFFPGCTEELVEEALKKFITEQNHGIHDPEKAETWVKFTLSMIIRELKNRGRSRKIAQIKHAIKVMAGCNITLYRKGEEIWQGSILQDLVTVNRDKYLLDTDSQHIARLPLFVSHAINHLDYRQFNYARLMSCNDQLTRWIYKQLIHRFRQASVLNDYHFKYTNLERDSGLLQQSRPNDNRRKVLTALDELVKLGVLEKYDVDVMKEGRKIIDVKYTVKPAHEFIRDQKAANKRFSGNQKRILKTKNYDR